jgi:hypothetical protein
VKHIHRREEYGGIFICEKNIIGIDFTMKNNKEWYWEGVISKEKILSLNPLFAFSVF